jgi:hypothetical protein
MKRTYLALAALAWLGGPLPGLTPASGHAAGLFSADPLDAERFAILAKPVGRSDWSLLVLEQLQAQAQPPCWNRRPDGLIDPSLNRFDFTGICGRYLDSNGFSVRVGDQDLGTTYRLRLQQVGNELLLQAVSPHQPTVLVLGRGTVPQRDRDAFVALQLDGAWQLQRRSFEGRSLNHLYFANATDLGNLIAQAAGAGATPPLVAISPRTGRPMVLPALATPPAPLASGGRGRGGRLSPVAPAMAGGLAEQADDEVAPGRTIALQVSPSSGTGADTP